MYYRENETDIDKFFKLRGIAYDEKTKQLSVPVKCKWLNNQNKCRLYAWRPYSCREYECEKLKNLPPVHYA
jgi:Fe-S-cluster containining protein